MLFDGLKGQFLKFNMVMWFQFHFLKNATERAVLSSRNVMIYICEKLAHTCAVIGCHGDQLKLLLPEQRAVAPAATGI